MRAIPAPLPATDDLDASRLVLRDGTTAHYIYYGCTRARDRDCKNQYIREEELIAELLLVLPADDSQRRAQPHRGGTCLQRA